LNRVSTTSCYIPDNNDNSYFVYNFINGNTQLPNVAIAQVDNSAANLNITCQNIVPINNTSLGTSIAPFNSAYINSINLNGNDINVSHFNYVLNNLYLIADRPSAHILLPLESSMSSISFYQIGKLVIINGSLNFTGNPASGNTYALCAQINNTPVPLSLTQYLSQNTSTLYGTFTLQSSNSALNGFPLVVDMQPDNGNITNFNFYEQDTDGTLNPLNSGIVAPYIGTSGIISFTLSYIAI